ncbi:TIR domain-containing protein [Mogibacterium timidum]|uniref:TIR domain-containing protein n=1 Tax=Mogibacterium timidum TaxID=35519 RepID=UPI0028D57262|nr:TIR domain-containing protein [Mogibacterium timidum]
MTYNLLISHSWTYSDAYEKLIDLLDAKPYFNYNNYSVHQNDPIHHANSDYQLRSAIKAQMQPVSCVLILAGVYASYSKWINIEIELAQQMEKTIIAIEPWGSKKTSMPVKNSADKIVKWNTDPIVDAIRGY